MTRAAAAFVVLSLAAPAAAEQRASQGRATTPVAAPAESADSVDVDRLPLNLNRIRRELTHAADLEERDGLNLRYRVHIYGAAPPIQIFTPEDNLRYGQAPYGAPTHQDILNLVTPQEFRTPVMDFSALMRWLAERQKKKDQNR
jgi:hypothetical protein